MAAEDPPAGHMSEERQREFADVMRHIEQSSGETFDDFNDAFRRYVSMSDEELKAGWPDLTGLERALVLYAFFFFVLTPVLLLWPLGFAYAWRKMQSAMTSPWMRLGATSALLLVAVGLFVVREDLRRLYGIGEIIVGLAVIWFGLTPSASEVAATLAVASGVYIVVRGLDNYARGTEQAQTAMATATEQQASETAGAEGRER